jgi:hypothetical protein
MLGEYKELFENNLFKKQMENNIEPNQPHGKKWLEKQP